jgi:hypothetical protein
MNKVMMGVVVELLSLLGGGGVVVDTCCLRYKHAVTY